MEYLCKSPRLFRITFNKITVEIKILRIAAKAFFYRTVLINTVVDTSVQTATNIINGNNSKNNIIRHFILIRNDISYHQHTCINAIRFAGMNAIVDEYNSFIILTDTSKIMVAI